MTGDSEKFSALFRAALRRERLFEEGPVGEMLAKDSSGNYIVSDADVPKLFFNDQQGSAEAIQAYLRANGDPLPLEDYGAHLMRESGAVRPDGTLDLTVLAAWEALFGRPFSTARSSK